MQCWIVGDATHSAHPEHWTHSLEATFQCPKRGARVKWKAVLEVLSLRSRLILPVGVYLPGEGC